MMKVKAYLAAILIFNGFISYNVHAFMGPKRWAQCAFMPGKSKCSVEEKKKARKWLAGASVIVIAAIAAGIGIKISRDEIKKRKQAELKAAGMQAIEAVAEKEELMEELIQENMQTLSELAQEAFEFSTRFKPIEERAKLHFDKRASVDIMNDIYTLESRRNPDAILINHKNVKDFLVSVSQQMNAKDKDIIRLNILSDLTLLSKRFPEVLTKLKNDSREKKFYEEGR